MRAYYSNGVSLDSHVDVSWRFNNCNEFTVRDIVECIVPVSDYCGGRSNFLISGSKVNAFLDKDGDKNATEMFGEDDCLYIEPFSGVNVNIAINVGSHRMLKDTEGMTFRDALKKVGAIDDGKPAVTRINYNGTIVFEEEFDSLIPQTENAYIVII